MKRREFLKNTSLSLPMAIGGFQLSALAKNRLFSLIDRDTDRILVLVQLNGGNDGLNTLIPLDQYANLSLARPELIIPENAVIKITDDAGFHPSMEAMSQMYADNKLNIVQSVAYPNQNRSHFRSTDIWTSGSASNEFDTTGWLGKYLFNRFPDYPANYPSDEFPDPFAIAVGNSVTETCQGPSANYSLAIVDPDSLNPLFEGEEGEVLDTPYGQELDFVRNAIKQTNAYAERIGKVAEMGKNDVEYPNTRLAEKLQTVAQLISGGLETRIYVVNIGGFDTHAVQIQTGDSTAGTHANLLQEVSDAIAAFQLDLESQGLDQNVLGMTFSEFGRQIRENFSLGTDHGTAAPLFLFGSCVNPSILGSNPEIPDQLEPQEGVAMQYDFRDIYGSVLIDWFGVEEEEVRDILHKEFIKLNVIECPIVSTENPEFDPEFEIQINPNPVKENMQIAFTLKDTATLRLSLFNAEGKLVDIISERKLQGGNHSISYHTGRLTRGNYYVHVRSEKVHLTKLFLKI